MNTAQAEVARKTVFAAFAAFAASAARTPRAPFLHTEAVTAQAYAIPAGDIKAPGFIALVEALPLTLSQKIQRSELRALAQSLPESAACVDTCAMKKRTA